MDTFQHCGLKVVQVAVVTDASNVLTKLGARDGLGLSTGKQSTLTLTAHLTVGNERPLTSSIACVEHQLCTN